MSVPKEEVPNLQATLMLEDIEASLPAEEVGVLSKSGRINKNGRKIAESVYQEFLSRRKGNYKQILELCREAESILDVKDPDSRDNETARIIQSIRGKVVYNAHRTWVEKQLKLEGGMGDTSASNVMSYAKILKANKEMNIYEAAANIEKERAEINTQLQTENKRLKQENLQILEKDGVKEPTLLKRFKRKFNTFIRKALEPKTRRKIIAGMLSAIAVAGIAFNYVANLRSTRLTDEAAAQALNTPKIAQVANITKNNYSRNNNSTGLYRIRQRNTKHC